MFAWFLDESPGSYRWGEVADPPVGPTDVRVRVVASGLNHIDHWLTQGLPRPKSFPHVPGADAAGIIDRVGSDVDGWSVGDEVVVNCAITTAAAIDELGVDSVLARGLQLLGEHRWGGHGEFVVVPAWNLVAKPAGRSWEECASYPVAAGTAWRMLRRGRFRPGERVLITGIGGGVSAAALAIVRHLGGEGGATSRGPDKCARAIELGASAALPSAGPYDVEVDLVIDSIGPAIWDPAIAALRPGGRFVTCGGTSGRSIEVNLPKLFFKQHELIGSTLASQEEFATVTGWVRDGLDIVIDDVVDLADYPRAVERVRRGQQFGKLVVRHES